MPAAGGFRFTTFHSGLHSIPPPSFIPLIVSLQPRQPTQKYLHSFHFAQAIPSVIFRPTLAVQPTFQTSQPKYDAPCHPYPFRSIPFSRHPCFFHPCHRYALRYYLPQKCVKVSSNPYSASILSTKLLQSNQ